MEAIAFSVSFLAEIALDIAVTCLFFVFSYKGNKWKLPLLIFFPIMTFCYLARIQTIEILVVLCLIIPFGMLILVRNIQASTYSSVLNNISNPSEDTKKKSRKNKPLTETIKTLRTINITMLTVMVVLAFTSGIQNIPQIMQVPLFWISTLATIGLVSFYGFANKKALNDKLNVTLKIFLIANYFIMGLAFVSLYFYLTTFFMLDLFTTLTISCLVVAVIFGLNNYVLSKVKEAIVRLISNKNFLKTFLKISKTNRIISLILVIVLSDIPVVIGMVISQNIEQMIIWTLGFFVFVSFTLMNALKEDLRIQLDAGLKDKSELEIEFKKLAEFTQSTHKEVE